MNQENNNLICPVEAPLADKLLQISDRLFKKKKRIREHIYQSKAYIKLDSCYSSY